MVLIKGNSPYCTFSSAPASSYTSKSALSSTSPVILFLGTSSPMYSRTSILRILSIFSAGSSSPALTTFTYVASFLLRSICLKRASLSMKSISSLICFRSNFGFSSFLAAAFCFKSFALDGLTFNESDTADC